MGNKDIHRDFIEERLMNIDLLPGVNVYARLECKGCRVPLTLSINYTPDVISDLKLFASFK
jgi:hypothetical protein